MVEVIGAEGFFGGVGGVGVGLVEKARWCAWCPVEQLREKFHQSHWHQLWAGAGSAWGNAGSLPNGSFGGRCGCS